MHVAILSPRTAFNPMHSSDPIYLQSFVTGEMVAHQIENTVDRKFGRDWEKGAGDYLKAKFYSRGAEQTVDRLMREGTGNDLTPHYLIHFLQNTPHQEFERTTASSCK